MTGGERPPEREKSKKMDTNVLEEIEKLRRASLAELQADTGKYSGKTPRPGIASICSARSPGGCRRSTKEI